MNILSILKEKLYFRGWLFAEILVRVMVKCRLFERSITVLCSIHSGRENRKPWFRPLYWRHRIRVKNGIYMKWPHFSSRFFGIYHFLKNWYFEEKAGKTDFLGKWPNFEKSPKFDFLSMTPDHTRWCKSVFKIHLGSSQTFFILVIGRFGA